MSTVCPAPRRRFFLSYRIAGSGFLLAVLLLNCWLTAGCVKAITGGGREVYVPDPEGGRDYRFGGIEMENSRFELYGFSVPLQPALSYWVKNGDQAAVKWDTFEFLWAQVPTGCSFASNPLSGECLVCDWCRLDNQVNPAGKPCLGVIFGGKGGIAEGYLQVVADPGFVQTPNPQTVYSFAENTSISKAVGACSNNFPPNNNINYPLSVFTPVSSGLYRISSSDPFVTPVGEANGEAKIHIVQSGETMTQTTAYQLTWFQTAEGTNYWKWEVRGEDFWQENFSPSLRVTDIRIRKGKCQPDPSQGKECLVPDDAENVKPSRILFLPSFADTVENYAGGSLEQFRCYADPNVNAAEGDYINLPGCRTEYSTSALTPVERLATPTYLRDSGRELEKLTWLVEFNPGEGADPSLTTVCDQMAPPPNGCSKPDGLELIMEFTLQAN